MEFYLDLLLQPNVDKYVFLQKPRTLYLPKFKMLFDSFLASWLLKCAGQD